MGVITPKLPSATTFSCYSFQANNITGSPHSQPLTPGPTDFACIVSPPGMLFGSTFTSSSKRTTRKRVLLWAPVPND